VLKVFDSFYRGSRAAELRYAGQRMSERPAYYGSRLTLAIIAYVTLAVLAGLTLSDWRFRGAVWALLAGLAVKTWVATKRG